MMSMTQRLHLMWSNLQRPDMRPRLAGLVIAVYAILLQLTPAAGDLSLTLLALPLLGWAGWVLLHQLYASAEPYGLALPATMIGLGCGFTLLLWLLTTLLLAA